MAPTLSKKTIIERELLLAIADGRLEDAGVLFRAGRYSAAVYLGGHAVECYLKAAICRKLDLDELPEVFAIHDLELLLLFSGLTRHIVSEGAVHRAFQQLQGVWKLGLRENVRYDDPSKYNQYDAESFLNWVNEVVKWVKPKTS